MSAGYENSSLFMQGMAEAAREVGLWPKLERALAPDDLAALMKPRENRWWPGSLLARVVEVAERESDAATIEQMAYLAVKGAVAPVAMPLIKVTVAVFGSSPGTILGRASTFGATALRGVELQWKPTGDRVGELICTYPEAVPHAYHALWKGTLRFVFELTRATGSIGPIARERGDTVLRISLQWS
jgi:hypothetical protein